MRLADLYKEGILFDPKGNYYGHQLYAVFLLITVGFIKYNYWVVAIIQALIYSFAALFLVRQMETYYKRDFTGLLLFLFIVPDIQHYVGSVLTESMAMTFVLLSYGMALKIFNSGVTVRRLLFISSIAACAVLTRTECTIVLLPLFYLMYPKIKEKLLVNVSTVMILPVCGLMVTGFLNYKTFGQFRLTSLHGGEVLFGGNNQNLDGSFHVFPDHRQTFIPAEHLAEYDSILALPLVNSYPARNAFYSRLVKEAWEKSPGDQLSVIPEKFAKNWLVPASFDMYTSDTTKTRGMQLGKLFQKKYFNNAWYAPYKHLFYLAIYWFTLIVILTGAARIKRSDRFAVSILLFWIVFIFFTLPFCGLPRWHMPVYPLLILTFTPYLFVERINKMFYGKNQRPPSGDGSL
jgi:hypothetical protein